MLKRSQYIVLGLVLFAVLVLLNLPPRTVARLKLAIGGLFLPLFGLSSAAQQAAAQGSALLSRRELLTDNTALRLENEKLHLRDAEIEGIRRESERLRQLLNWKPRMAGKPRLARVIARDPSNWWRTVQIDLGTRDGVTNDLPVLSAEGLLVGRVKEAGLTRSQVVLIGDPDCPVSALVVGPRVQGMIGPVAGAPLDKSQVVLGSLPNNSALKPGQQVVTSGLGQIFPKDIPVGTILEVHAVEFGLYMEADVKLGANLSALEYVWVLLP